MVVATPADSHVEMIEAAVAAGAHIFVDKPLAPIAVITRKRVVTLDR